MKIPKNKKKREKWSRRQKNKGKRGGGKQE